MARDLADQLVGSTGLLPGVEDPAWLEWSMEPEQCDALGLLPLIGLQWLAARSQIVTGDAFVVARAVRADSAWPLPIRFLVLDGDALGPEGAGTMSRAVRGARIQQGIEYGPSGRRIAYHFRVPSRSGYAGDDRPIRVAAADVYHLFEPEEPVMERGLPWFTPIVLDMSDLGAYQQAVLKKAELHAKIAAISSRLDGIDASVAPNETDDPEKPITPAYELQITPGTEFKAFPHTPTDGVKDFSRAILGGAAVGVGAQLEDVTGDYAGLNFSQARLSGLKQERRSKGRRARGLMPLSRWMYRWCRKAAMIRGMAWPEPGELEWLHPPMDIVEPDREGRAAQQDVRSGFSSLFDELRRRGHIPRAYLERVAEEREFTRGLGLVFDTDPELLSAQGQAQRVKPGEEPDPPEPPGGAGNGDGEGDGADGGEGNGDGEGNGEGAGAAGDGED